MAAAAGGARSGRGRLRMLLRQPVTGDIDATVPVAAAPVAYPCSPALPVGRACPGAGAAVFLYS